MTATSRLTGAITALLVLVSLGLFGSAGWLAALVLAVIAGGLLAGIIHWLVDQGPRPMHGSDWLDDVGAAPVATMPELVAVPARPAEAPVSHPEATLIQVPTWPVRGPEGAAAALAPDGLVEIKGIGPKIELALHQAGVTRLAQIAAWDDAQIDAMADRIGRKASRIRSQNWVGQARVLSEGKRQRTKGLRA